MGEGRGGLFGLYSQLSSSLREVRAEAQVGVETGMTEECCFWIAPSGSLSFPFTQAHLSRDGTTDSGLDAPSSTSNEEMSCRHGHRPM